jgi:hypothetical protein
MLANLHLQPSQHSQTTAPSTQPPATEQGVAPSMVITHNVFI